MNIFKTTFPCHICSYIIKMPNSYCHHIWWYDDDNSYDIGYSFKLFDANYPVVALSTIPQYNKIYLSSNNTHPFPSLKLTNFNDLLSFSINYYNKLITFQ